MKAALLVVLCLAATIACAADRAAAERKLAMAYYAKKDSARSVEHFARAVDLGDAESAIRLGKMYEYGMGVAADETQAALWYTRGAELGDAQAQFEASIFYYKGRGVARDPVEAVKWWTLAMERRNSPEHVRTSAMSAEATLTSDEVSRGRALAQAWRERRAPSRARKGS